MVTNCTNKGQNYLKQNLIESSICTGCGACINICPYQRSYEDNLIILDQCNIENGMCYEFCPRTFINLTELQSFFFDHDDLTPEIGAAKSFYIARANDQNLRKKTQHGGTVTALMQLALQEKIIETAVVSKSNDFLLPNPVSIKTADGLRSFGKSNFCVSPTLAEVNRIMKEDSSSIGVVATPCQSLSLYKAKRKSMESNKFNYNRLKLVIGLFCGWALSWNKLCHLLNQKGVDTTSIESIDILPSKYQIMEIITSKGIFQIPIEEVKLCIRPSCGYCFDMTSEFSDISVGSARLPGGWNESKEWNLIIVRSKLGQQLIELAKSKNTLEFSEINENNIAKIKVAAMQKKKRAVDNLIKKSGSKNNLLYLDCNDPIFSKLIA